MTRTITLAATGAEVSTADPQWADECLRRAACVNEAMALPSLDARRAYLERIGREHGAVFRERLEGQLRMRWRAPNVGIEARP